MSARLPKRSQARPASGAAMPSASGSAASWRPASAGGGAHGGEVVGDGVERAEHDGVGGHRACEPEREGTSVEALAGRGGVERLAGGAPGLNARGVAELPVGGAAAGEQDPRERDPEQAGGEVDEEDQPPPGEREQQPADRGPEREPDGLGGALRAEAARERARGQVLGDQRDAVGLEHGGAEPLEHARADQPAEAGGEPAEQGAEGEDGEAVGVERLAPEPVREAPDGDERAGEHEQVGERDPAHRARAGVQPGADAGQCERDDRDVELAHESADADGADDIPAGAGARADAVGAGGSRSSRRRSAAKWEGIAGEGRSASTSRLQHPSTHRSKTFLFILG